MKVMFFKNKRYSIKLISDGSAFDIRLTETYLGTESVVIFECNSPEGQRIKAEMLKVLAQEEKPEQAMSTEEDWISTQTCCICDCQDIDMVGVDNMDNCFCEDCISQNQEEEPENWE